MKKRLLYLTLTLVGLGMLAASCCSKDESNATVAVSAADATINTIMQRKSVRSYTDSTIAPELMESMLRAAVAAPSGMDVRPWHIVVVTDKSKYDELFAGNFNMEKFKQSAAVVIFCADTTVTRPPREDPNAPAVTSPNPIWRDDMGACTENFLLAAEAYGLGAVWTACYPFHDRMDPVANYLKLPSNIVPYSIVPVGYPNGEFEPKDKWDTTRIHYEMF